MKKTLILTVILSLNLILFSGPGFSDPKGPPETAASQPSRQSMIEMHQRMASMHSKMAACLQSGKPMPECRQEMMKDWPAGRGGGMMKGGCPMMDQ